MGSLSTALFNSAQALRTFGQCMGVTQNNVANANTPGYARQVQPLEARPFDIEAGLPGGMFAGPVQSTRSAFAESSVQTEQSAVSLSKQTVADLQTLQPQFDLSGSSGVSGAIDNLFNSFSQLSMNPNDAVYRQNVLNQAQATAQAFQQTATGILNTGTAVNSETKATLDDINRLAATIAQINSQMRTNQDGSVDAGVDAQLHSSLEELSQDAGFTTLRQPDGSISVYLGGQTPLVLGNTAFSVQGDFSLPQTVIRDQSGKDITGQITGGQLASELQTKNTLLPSYMSGLNTLAQTLADQVNTTLANGLDANGQAPATDLFNYDAASSAAFTLSVNSLTPDQLAAASLSAPGGNGNALALSALANAKVVNGYTFIESFGVLGGRLGQDISNAQDQQQTSQNLLTQAQNLRSQTSGVSLDAEAANLLAYQQAYQATAKMFSILNSLDATTLGLIPS
ncbi:MAG: flagellar hook-associated protein FlgK [Bryobacteraceae bacterium]|jgi:flagellar hook-associated protein 1 FlgK